MWGKRKHPNYRLSFSHRFLIQTCIVVSCTEVQKQAYWLVKSYALFSITILQLVKKTQKTSAVIKISLLIFHRANTERQATIYA